MLVEGVLDEGERPRRLRRGELILDTLKMKPVMEGSTVVSQVCAMPRARATSVDDPFGAAGVGTGPGALARAFSLASVGPPGSIRPSAKAGTCIF